MLLYQNDLDNRRTIVKETTTGISASLITKSNNPVMQAIREQKATALLQQRIYSRIVKPFIDCNFDYRVIRQPDDFSVELSVDKFQKDRVVPMKVEETTIKVILYKNPTHLSGDNPQMYEWWCWNSLETPIANIVTIKNLKELDEFNRKYGCSPRIKNCGC